MTKRKKQTRTNSAVYMRENGDSFSFLQLEGVLCKIIFMSYSCYNCQPTHQVWPCLYKHNTAYCHLKHRFSNFLQLGNHNCKDISHTPSEYNSTIRILGSLYVCTIIFWIAIEVFYAFITWNFNWQDTLGASWHYFFNTMYLFLNPIIVTFNVVECLQDKLVQVQVS